MPQPVESSVTNPDAPLRVPQSEPPQAVVQVPCMATPRTKTNAVATTTVTDRPLKQSSKKPQGSFLAAFFYLDEIRCISPHTGRQHILPMRILLTLLALIPALHAENDFSIGASAPENNSSVASFVSENITIAPGKPFTVALKLEHPEEWHSYYRNSGGIEKSPVITWKLPQGATAGPIQWPTPGVKEGFEGKSFIYAGSPVFLVEITPPASLVPGDSFTIAGTAKWQICKDLCKDEFAKLSLSLQVGENAITDSYATELFQMARQKIPQSGFKPSDATARIAKDSPDSIMLQLPATKTPPVEFVPNQPYIRALSDGGEVTTNDEGYLLILQRKKVNFLDEPIPQGNTVSGILIGEKSIVIPEISLAGENAESTAVKNSEAETGKSIPFAKLLTILGLMFLGGLILNLMPCVFPVIGLKIMGFVQQAGHNRRSIALHGVSFTLGVFASFAVLTGILFAVRSAALRNGTEAIGWGYQLQNPWVVVVLLLLMFILGLNMFGLFELGTSATSVGGNLQSKSGHAGSFFSGVLATVVATPCSGPFLGAAIGVAMGLPAVQFFSSFGAMALGLALPYLILSIFPALVEKLPRPGAWMESFKQGMSFLLFGTAGYFLWIYGGLIGQDYLLSPILGLAFVAIAAWIYGRWHLPHKTTKTRFSALFITALFAIAGTVLALPPKPNKLWSEWSEEKTVELLAEGKPVYIDFTAQWCATCQWNKKVAYTDEVLALAKIKGIVFLKADKTRDNPAIDAKVREFGRDAIPVNVLLIPGKEPMITPPILTPGILKDLFNKVQ